MSASSVVERVKAPWASWLPRRAKGWPDLGLSIAGILCVVVALATFFPQLFTGLSPVDADLGSSLQPPNSEHILGTDQLGRDIYARVIHGARYSLGVGLGATLLAVVLGAIVGVVSAVSTRFMDSVFMRLIDILLSFPNLLLALLVIVVAEPVFGRGPITILIAIGLGSFPGYARIVRAQALLVRRSGYVEAAVVMGVPRWRTTIRHVAPNALGPLLILATIGVGVAIITGAALSFLGLGPQSPTPEWGVMLAEGRNLLGVAWWLTLFPGLAITCTVIVITVVGRHFQARFEGRRTT